MNNKKTPILLPIETIVRELEWKIDLGVRLARYSRKIFIGQQDVIHKLVPYLHDGMYVGKNIFATGNDSPRLSELRENGFKTVYLHEEGGVFRNDENEIKATLKSQYNPELFGENELLCTWGRTQLEIDKSRGASKGFVTGHPKFDQYKSPQNKIFHSEAEGLKERHGRIILINTNFSLFNIGNLNSVALELQRKRPELTATEASNLYWMITLIVNLSEHFPDRTIVVRPHPSEGIEIYNKMLSHLQNVIIERKGSLGAWLMAADCLVQTCCTTAIEAYFAGTPVLCYKHQMNLTTDMWLPKQIGDRATNPNEAIKWIKNLSNYKSKLRNRAQVENLLENFRQLSEPRFYELCEDAASQQKISLQKFEIAELAAKRYARSLQVRRLFGNLIGKQSTRYHNAKFPLFSKKEIESRVGAHSNASGKSVHVSFINRYLFTIDTE